MTLSTLDHVVMSTAPRDLFIDGVWIAAGEGRRFAVHDPATGAVLADVADADADDAEAALAAASCAATSWAGVPSRARANLLQAAFTALTDQREDFARVITAEMGKPLAEARTEVDYAADFFRWFAEEAVRAYDTTSRSTRGHGRIGLRHRPVGPSLLITPWNFPLAMATRKIAPALAAGCTVVLKPTAQTPLSSLLLAELLHRLGVPAGVVNVVPTSDAAALSDRLMDDPRLRKGSFTGSTGVGQTLLRRSASQVLRTSLELGGNAPLLVFDDADIDVAVEGAIAAKFRNGGQSCTGANRLYVQRSISAEFINRFARKVGGSASDPARTRRTPSGR